MRFALKILEEKMALFIGILLVIMAAVLVAVVLAQEGKEKGLSGTIAGGADNFYNQGKGASAKKLLPKITTILSIVFVVLVIVLYVIAPNGSADSHEGHNHDAEVTDTASAE